MRTTIDLAPDVLKAVERLRNDREVGLSEAVNELVRRGLAAPSSSSGYVRQTFPLGAKVDVSNIAEVLDMLDAE